MLLTKSQEVQKSVADQLDKQYQETDEKLIDFLPLFCALAYSILNLFIIGISGNFPLNDDAFYALPVRDFLETGKFYLEGTLATCHLQVLLGALACSFTDFSYETLRLLTSVLGLLTTWGIFLVIREVGLRRSVAGLFAMAFAINPMVVNLSYSFMTDIYYTCLTTFYLYFTIKAINRSSIISLTVGSMFLVASIFVRQFSMLFLIPNAILLACLYFGKGNRHNLLKMVIPLFGIPIAAVLVNSNLGKLQVINNNLLEFRRMQVIDNIIGLLQNPFQAIQYLGSEYTQASLTIALLSMPVAAFIGICLIKAKVFKQRSFQFAGIIATAMVIFVLSQAFIHENWLLPYKENLFKIVELGPYTLLGTRVNPENYILQLTITTIAAGFAWIFSTALLGGFFNQFSSITKKPVIPFIQSGLIIFFLFTAALFTIKPFDRYLVVLLPLVMVSLALTVKPLLTNSRSKWLWIFPGCLAVVVGGYSTLAHHDYISWNRARWTAIELLQSRGVNPDTIDGGAEYRHAEKLVFRGKINMKTKSVAFPKNLLGREPQSKWRWWPVRGDDYVITHVPTEHYVTVFSVPYWSGLYLKECEILVQKRVENF